MSDQEEKPELLGLTAKIVAAHLSGNSVPPDDLPAVIRGVYDALAGAEVEPAPPPEPAVAVTKSVTPSHPLMARGSPGASSIPASGRRGRLNRCAPRRAAGLILPCAAHLSGEASCSSALTTVLGSFIVEVLGPSSASAGSAHPAVDPHAPAEARPCHCLEDGKKLKMLKRHLRADHDMAPDDYRAKWGLAADYPMVAPVYSKQRSELAKAAGFGQRPPKPKPKSRKRRAKA